ncbi:MAG: DNA-processing protein DprA, partial [Verrucomicrobiota bacterium]
LGSGIDIIYPPENTDLYHAIQEQGAVLSEFPFGHQTSKTTFPLRNRIVAGLCKAVIVVESDLRGGSLITARYAADQNRSVFAVPGRIDQASSRGCHRLIREGASLVTCADDVLEELDFRGQTEFSFDAPETEAQTAARERPKLSPTEERVLGTLSDGSILPADTITDRLQMPAHEVASTLMLLELKRLIAKHADGRFEAR